MVLSSSDLAQNEREVELHNLLEFGGNLSVGLLMAWEKPIFTRFLKLVFDITVERRGIAGFT